MGEHKTQIQVGVSSCLLGHKVRFDGNHKHHELITQNLGKFFEFVAICPEVAIGMGVPRKPIRLVGDVKMPRALGVHSKSMDVTDQMVKFAQNTAANIGHLSGYIFKKGSPSCGMQDVRVYRDSDVISNSGVGLYAQEIMLANPLLPVEEEGRLMDQDLKDNFVQRVVVFKRWQQLEVAGLSASKIIDFHARHKFILLAHHEKSYQSLGRLVADAGTIDLEAFSQKYIKKLMCGLKSRSSRQRHANVLRHIMSFLKGVLNTAEKRELSVIIDNYRRGDLPLDAPVSLLKHHVRNSSSTNTQPQFYLFGIQD